MTDNTTDMGIIVVDQPADDNVMALALEPGQIYRFDMAPQSWRGVVEEGGSLSIAFDNNSTLVLENFTEAMEAEIPAGISFNGGQYLSLEEFSRTLRVAKAMSEGMVQDVPPTAVLTVATAEELSGIEPATGGTSGTVSTADLLFLSGIILTFVWLIYLFRNRTI